MNVSDFLPYYGSATNLRDLSYRYSQGDISFTEAALVASGIGAVSGTTTVILAETIGYTHGTVAVARAGVAMANPLFIAPVGMVVATSSFPEVAGPQYQSAMSGQMSIGGGGHDLIYGNHERGSFSAIWNYFAQNF